MLRVFIGIKISQELSKETANWKALHKSFLVRFIDDSNLHLTLIPPWYIHPEDVEKIIKDLEIVQKQTRGFIVNFTRISYGPNSWQPRLIWATGERTNEMSELKKNINLALGKHRDNRPPIPHLTLARFQLKKFQTFTDKKLDEEILWEEKVENFALFESVLRQSGAQYKLLHEFKFKNIV